MLRIFADGSLSVLDEDGHIVFVVSQDNRQTIARYIVANEGIYNWDNLTNRGKIICDGNIECASEISGKFRPTVPLANHAKALPNRMYVPVWIGNVYFYDSDYRSVPKYRSKVQTYSGNEDNFDITVGWLGGDGQCSVVFKYPFGIADHYFVTFQGSDNVDNWASFVCLKEKRDNGFIALAADDNTPNNLNFSMQIWAKTT